MKRDKMSQTPPRPHEGAAAGAFCTARGVCRGPGSVPASHKMAIAGEMKVYEHAGAFPIC